MLFPYEAYETLTELPSVYYPMGEKFFARWVFQTIDQAGKLLTQLLDQPMPALVILLVTPSDWPLAPHDEAEQQEHPHPYWTDATSPPSLVVPMEIDPIFGEPTQEKLASMLYHELALAFLEDDPRPWPNDYPLWAEEWQFKFAELWLAQSLDGVQGVVNKDLHECYEEIFEPEADGKTPVTVRGFDWYEDTSPEDYLCYELLLERFAADLLAHYAPTILPRFLALYRAERVNLLSEDVTAMLAAVLGPDGVEWLEDLVYF
jgi:hypothetical protein